MFLASDRRQHREHKVRSYLDSEPSLSLLLGAVNFEWTVCRAVLFLSQSPNVELRARMADFYSLDAYKDLWKLEVMSARQCSPLADIVRNWRAVRDAFKARNILVHGRDRYTKKMAEPNIEAPPTTLMSSANRQGVRFISSCLSVLGVGYLPNRGPKDRRTCRSGRRFSLCPGRSL
jgi:hypothetical protein